MLNIQELKTLLRDRRLTVIAKETGISYGTLLAIRDRDDANPTLSTMETLIDYLLQGGSQK